MSQMVDTPHRNISYSPTFVNAPLSPATALRRIWRHPQATLAGLTVTRLWCWLLPIGLALSVFYVRLFMLAFVGQPMSDVAVVRGGLVVFVGWPLAALLLCGCCQWLEAKPYFLQILLLYMWTTLPLTLRSAVQILYLLLAGQPLRHPGLAGLLATADQSEPLARVGYFLLGQVDLFAFWHLALLAITIHLTATVPLHRAWQGVGLYVGFLLLLGVVVALLSSPIA